jgi:hypothetical protein
MAAGIGWSMPARFALLALLLASSLSAGDWRTYAGGFSSRWKTTGPHGHDQEPCAYPQMTNPAPGIFMFLGTDCNPVDFGRANLDNSIGFRLGRERDFISFGPLRFVGGGEGSISHTEYNETQSDFAFINAALVGGADLDLWGSRGGFRYGAGPFTTTDSRVGLQTWREVSLSVPIRAGAALRISQRRSSSRRAARDGTRNVEILHENIPATETSLLFVASPGARSSSHWDFAATSGTTNPGFGPAQSLALHTTAYHRLSAFRDVRTPSTQLELSWISTAHESSLFSAYRGYPGNQRGKTINGFGLGAHRSVDASRRVSLRYGGGIEVADWRDPYPLLVSGNGRVVRGGVETAVTGSAALRYRLGRGLSIEANAQQLYWRAIHLGETRWGVGLALTR